MVNYRAYRFRGKLLCKCEAAGLRLEYLTPYPDYNPVEESFSIPTQEVDPT